MKMISSVCLIGRLTRDPELRATKSGINCVSVTVAINNGNDKDGNEIPADFPKIYVFNKSAENLSKYCKQGSLIAVDGRIKTRDWDKEDGTRGYETYVVADRIQFLDQKQREEAPLPEPDFVPAKEENDPFADFGQSIEIDENDLPW